MEQRYLKSRLLYAPRRGVFYWITPPANHAGLLGEEAGAPAMGSAGKAYHLIAIDGVKHKRGRLAFLYMVGRWPEDAIDHIDGDSLNDVWDNLREATIQQNNWNRQPRQHRDLPMGVRSLPSGRFGARIGLNGTSVFLGAFDTVGDAASAYRNARRKYYGEFA